MVASTVSASKRLPVSDGCESQAGVAPSTGLGISRPAAHGSPADALAASVNAANASATVPPAAVTTDFILVFQKDTAVVAELPAGYVEYRFTYTSLPLKPSSVKRLSSAAR